MLFEDHKRRVARLLRGERRTEDLARLFSDLRNDKPGRASVREVGHFAAHRAERDAGLSFDRANDLQTSARLWQKQFDGVPPTVEHLREAGRANLNIMPDDRIRERFGISRQTAEQTFSKALRKFAAKRPLKSRENELLKVLGLSLMWQYALDDTTLNRDFGDLLVAEGALADADKAAFAATATFVTLYALSIMHGVMLKLGNGATSRLRLAAATDTGFLRIKVDIPVDGGRKPLVQSAPLFETSLAADTHCDLALLEFTPELEPAIEKLMPAEIDRDRLVPLG